MRKKSEKNNFSFFRLANLSNEKSFDGFAKSMNW